MEDLCEWMIFLLEIVAGAHFSFDLAEWPDQATDY
jgi:hypothetical protein